MSDIIENIRKVRKVIADAAIRSSRNPDDVRLVAVSKKKSAQLVSEALKAGLGLFGENKVQEARDKIPLVTGDAQWHMIGRLQKNKARYIPHLFTMVHSVDSFDLALALNRSVYNAYKKGQTRCGQKLDILIQVNLSMEESKGGVSEKEVLPLIQNISKLSSLKIKGLMTMPPFTEDPEESRIYFRRLRELSDAISSN